MSTSHWEIMNWRVHLCLSSTLVPTSPGPRSHPSPDLLSDEHPSKIFFVNNKFYYIWLAIATFILDYFNKWITWITLTNVL